VNLIANVHPSDIPTEQIKLSVFFYGELGDYDSF